MRPAVSAACCVALAVAAYSESMHGQSAAAGLRSPSTIDRVYDGGASTWACGGAPGYSKFAALHEVSWA